MDVFDFMPYLYIFIVFEASQVSSGPLLPLLAVI